MNLERVLHILGLLLLVLAAAELVPLAWCVAPWDPQSATGFLAGASITGLAGAWLRRRGQSGGELYRRDGVLIVVGAWILASLSGAIPYLAAGAIQAPVDALFESASGFTTTGASILVDIEAASRSILFWRSFTQWLGGIGIVVLLVALLSELGPGARFLFKLEVPGPKAEIMHTRVRETANALARIYVALTLLETVLLMLAGLDLYDAVTLTFSTVSTGGFSPYADSAAHFSTAAQGIVMLFMILAGINFSLYYALVRKRDLGTLRDAELRLYLLLLAGVSAVVAIDLLPRADGSAARTVFDGAFHVVSILTTTGFATTNFAQWPTVSDTALVALMVFGGCAGSTAGGAKIIRLMIGWKAAMREVRLTFNPAAVIAVVVGGRAVPEDSVRSVVGLLLLWIAAWGLGTVLLSVGDTGVITAATGSLATLSNIGPGLARVGPDESFAFFASWQKLLMVGLMCFGRLECFAVLALLQRQFWRR